MALLTPLWTAAPLHTAADIQDFLAPHGVAFETWSVSAAAAALADRASIDDAAKAAILTAFDGHLAGKMTDSGYTSADVIAIRPHLPGLDAALAAFDKVHFHDDDEIRAIDGGSGVFGFILDDGRQLLLRVEAGEYISVPAGMWHWFYCESDRNITAIRLFKDAAGWTPHYRDTARGPLAAAP